MVNEQIIALAVALCIVGAITILMHERHYQSRRERMLEARLRVLEEIIGEDRRS